MHHVLSRSSPSTVLYFYIVTIVDIPPVVTEGPANKTYYMLYGTNKTFNCKARGVPTPKITWHRNGTLLKNGERISVDTNGTLRLKSVTEEENGLYSCLAKNLATTIESKATISVFCKTISNTPVVM